MYKREFDQLIISKNIPNYVMLYGACEYQLLFLENEILKLWGDGNILKFYFDEYDFKTAKSHLSQASLFGEKNILLLKVEKNIHTKELEEFVMLCKKSDINHFLFVFYGDDAKAKTFSKPFDKSFVRIFKTNVGEAVGFLSYEAKKINLPIDNFVLQHLYFIHNENLSLSVSELNKLSLLNKEVTTVDVDNLVFGMGELALEDFIIKLLNGEKSANLYRTISQSGTVDEIRLINAMQSHLFQLFLFHSYIKINGSFDALKILGHPLPIQIAKQRSEVSIRLKPKTFSKLFNILSNAEYDLKTNSSLDKESYIVSVLLEVQRGLK